MSTNQTETHRNEGNSKVKEVAKKVSGDDSAEHTKQQSGKDKTVLGEVNDDPREKTKDRK